MRRMYLKKGKSEHAVIVVLQIEMKIVAIYPENSERLHRIWSTLRLLWFCKKHDVRKRLLSRKREVWHWSSARVSGPNERWAHGGINIEVLLSKPRKNPDECQNIRFFLWGKGQ